VIAPALSHLLAAYAVVAAPWLGFVWFRKLRERLAAGVPDAKLRIYHELVIEQSLTAAAVIVLWRLGSVPAATLGLVAPRAWLWVVAILSAIVVLIVWSSIRLRPRAEELRKKSQHSVGALLPDSDQERMWFGAVSVGAGISEELLFRGFLIYYLAVYLPHSNPLERALVTALIFGFAHLYQGWKGMIGTGVVGLILAGLYLMTGSLVLPIAVHAITDARVLLIFPRRVTPQAFPAEGNA